MVTWSLGRTCASPLVCSFNVISVKHLLCSKGRFPLAPAVVPLGLLYPLYRSPSTWESLIDLIADAAHGGEACAEGEGVELRGHSPRSWANIFQVEAVGWRLQGLLPSGSVCPAGWGCGASREALFWRECAGQAQWAGVLPSSSGQDEWKGWSSGWWGSTWGFPGGLPAPPQPLDGLCRCHSTLQAAVGGFPGRVWCQGPAEAPEDLRPFPKPSASPQRITASAWTTFGVPWSQSYRRAPPGRSWVTSCRF